MSEARIEIITDSIASSLVFAFFIYILIRSVKDRKEIKGLRDSFEREKNKQ